jgi:hypothetical protein
MPAARIAAALATPLFSGVAAYRDLMLGTVDVDALNARRDTGAAEGSVPKFAAQTRGLLADGLHYEMRIAERGIVATRLDGVHDLFNAFAWLRHPELKHALNARQVADIASVGPKVRTRGQCALTHFDEAGAIVWIADRELRACWDAHDWRTLFLDRGAAWGQGIAVTVFGHALLELALCGEGFPLAKALAVTVDADALHARAQRGAVAEWRGPERAVAAAIRAGRLLVDPQELRPLPLAGIPGWATCTQDARFYATAPCFRPLRPGRRYPDPFDPDCAPVREAAADATVAV